MRFKYFWRTVIERDPLPEDVWERRPEYLTYDEWDKVVISKIFKAFGPYYRISVYSMYGTKSTYPKEWFKLRFKRVK